MRDLVEDVLNKIGHIALSGRQEGTGYVFDAPAVREQLKRLITRCVEHPLDCDCHFCACYESRSPDDPVRRDWEGWQAGIDCAIERLQDDISEWSEGLSVATAAETEMIHRCIVQTQKHIAQIRELKYARRNQESPDERKGN